MNLKRNIFIIFCTLMMLTSCSVSKRQYTIGEEFNVDLEGEGNGGFDWNMEEIHGISLVGSTRKGTKKDNGFYEFSKVFTLKGTSIGTYDIKFKKIRSFQPELILDEHIKIIKIKIKK